MSNPERTPETEAHNVDDDNTAQPAPNRSTDHQPQGDAARPSDRLDRDQPPPEDDGGRKSSLID